MITDYSGPRSRITIDRALQLDSRHAVQLKCDGVYVQARTDRIGQIYALHYRSGAPVARADAADLIGLHVGAPLSVLHGELMVQTEAAQRETGPRRIHLYDVSRYLGRAVTSAPYSERYGLLHAWQASVECYTGETERRSDEAHWRDIETGRYARPTAANLSRVPVLPLVRGRDGVRELWQAVERGQGEGIVVCRLDAPLGARSSKLKVKPADTLDVRIEQVGKGAAVVSWRGRRFVISAKGKVPVVGEVWELVADGWTKGGAEPKFPRLKRRRADLAA